MIRIRQTLFTGLGVAAAMLLAASSAEALNITPTSGVLNVSRWEDLLPTTNDNPGVLAEASSLCGCDISNATEAYKDESGGTGGTETITENLSGQAYLLVKDGNNFPAWYLFDLTALGWNGTDTLNLSGFWEPGNGEISYAGLFGGTSTPVPEPATLSLLGLGLAGAALRRRFSRVA